jgi:hypothetical protein
MPIEPKSQRSGSADNHGLDSEVAAASAAAMECRAVSDFPEWMAPMMVKELRQGLRARWFVVPFVLIHAVAAALVWVEFAAGERDSTGGIEAGLGHSFFWGLAFLVVAGILPLRGLDGLAQELPGGNAQLISLTGLSRWRISVGKWLTQMALCGLTLLSLLPYAIVRYFFGGVEPTANFYALAAIIGASSALSALLIGASGYRSYLSRGLLTAATYGLVGLPGAALVVQSRNVQLWAGENVFSLLLSISLAVGAMEFFVFYTLCGLQLTRAHLRVALWTWEIPPTRPVLMLFFFGPVYAAVVSGFTCGFGAFAIGALLIWWVSSLDRERVRLPTPAFRQIEPDARSTPPERVLHP